ncbi:MAG: 50S ribosomal protein L18 [Candidatus Levybacteria bacterium]|nr:50S ribosomal protein L18 [Candidatus Levybacteria bacterium]
MSMNQDRITRKLRRVRRKIQGSKDAPRLSVFRSSNHIYAQLIDDEKKETILAVSEKKLGKIEGKKLDRSKELGLLLAKEALGKKIKKVIFDRGKYAYKGRVKALAEGAREGGLNF